MDGTGALGGKGGGRGNPDPRAGDRGGGAGWGGMGIFNPQATTAAQQIVQKKLPAPPPMSPIQMLMSSFVPRYRPVSTVSKYPGV